MKSNCTSYSSCL